MINGFKGFGKDLKCRGYQFEVGNDYEHEGEVVACESGFHIVERPLDVFNYYQPSQSRYCKVEGSGKTDKHGSDTKVACQHIKIGAEIGIIGLVKAQIEYVKSRTTFENTDPKQATAGNYGAATAGENGAATAGYNGAATAGYKGAATAGENGAATAGDNGAATAGNYGAATAGEKGAATAGENGAATSRGTVSVGDNGCGLARGNGVKIKGGIGSVLVICEENKNNYDIASWKSVVVDGEKIKADTFYGLVNGEFVEVEDE